MRVSSILQVRDISEQCAMLTLIGPESDNVLKELAGVSGPFFSD